jgi:hypothetical protein
MSRSCSAVVNDSTQHLLDSISGNTSSNHSFVLVGILGGWMKYIFIITKTLLFNSWIASVNY